MQRARLILAVLCISLAVVPTSAKAGDVLEQVPRDALGFVVVRNLARTDARASKLLATVKLALPSPLTVVRGVAGVGDGLDTSRDSMLAFLPPESNSQQYHLAVWLPVKDYDALIRSLNGDPERRVAVVTVAGEDLLAVRHQDWAVISDPDQRDRLEALRDQPVSPPSQVADWKPWLETNDTTLVVLPAGMKIAWNWAMAADAEPAAEPRNRRVNGDIFEANGGQPAAIDWKAIRSTLRTALESMPAASRWAADAESAAFGVRVDDAGNSAVGARLAFAENALPPNSNSAAVPPRLFEGGDFISNGWGVANKEWLVPLVRPYVMGAANGIAAEFGVTLKEPELSEFRGMAERAVAEVEAFSLLSRLGEVEDGVYSNSFLAVRVMSADEFVARVNDAIQIWNRMQPQGQGEVKLLFEPRETKIGDLAGTEWSVDIIAALAMDMPPEAKTSQEKLFGPGARFRVQLVKVDDHTVLLGNATEGQAAKVLTIVRAETASAPLKFAELRGVDSLLATEADWRMYLSPHGYVEWQKWMMDAVTGPVIGGPLVEDFPAGPPIGAAGGIEEHLLWAEVAVPAETLQDASEFVRK